MLPSLNLYPHFYSRFAAPQALRLFYFFVSTNKRLTRKKGGAVER